MEAGVETELPKVIQKYIRTRKCGCGECRFQKIFTPSIKCLQENFPTAIWLWTMNPEYFKRALAIEPAEAVETESGC